MNDHSPERETTVSPYIPSARRGIHSYGNTLTTNDQNMVRYGLKSRMRSQDNKCETSQLDQGVDEIDNAMSKCVRQASPLLVRHQKQKGRRNSLSIIPNEEFSDDDEDSNSDLLAKSLPAILPSYCSDGSTQESLHNSFLNNESISLSGPTTRTQDNRSKEHNFDKSINRCSNTLFEVRRDKKDFQENRPCNCMILSPTIAVLGIIISVVYYTDILQLKLAQTTSTYDELKFYKDMNELREKYKVNDNSILEVQSGLSTILERNDTGSFIFVYNGKSVNFDYVQFSNFMEDITLTAARFLRNGSSHNQPIVVHGSELDMHSHSELMNKYRHDVAKSGVMLVKEVDSIPPTLAMAFHYFCDEYNPLVAKSAIFFTLNLASCTQISDYKSTHTNVEKCLANKWNAVPKDNIKPLLARVVNVVVDVTGVA